MANSQVRQRLINLAEAGRKDLPGDFLEFCESLEGDLSTGLRPQPKTKRGAQTSIWVSKIGPAIVSELHALLCTRDSKYADVRRTGKGLAEKTIPALGIVIAGTFGVPEALATAAVAFVALAVFRVGVATFCRLCQKEGHSARGQGATFDNRSRGPGRAGA
jgi:hypothetical protein